MHTTMRLAHKGIYSDIRFPCTEKELQRLTIRLDLPNAADTKVNINNIYDNDKLNVLLSGREYKLDELNYWMKRLDSLEQWEMDTFYAVAYSQKITSMKDMINLTFHTQCYSLVNDFSDLNKLGKDLYLRTVGALNSKDYKAFDGKRYVAKLMSANTNPTVTPYGILYENDIQSELVYNGRTLPAYQYDENPITLLIFTETGKEYLYLPVEKSEITKSLQRLGADRIEEVKLMVEDFSLPENIAEFVFADQSIDILNQYAMCFKSMGNAEISALSELIKFAKITTSKELDTLMECIHEFECFPNIRTDEQYGRYMICESGHFEYDSNLEEYINFKAYGEDRVSRETGGIYREGLSALSWLQYGNAEYSS